MTIKFSDITGGGIPYGDNAGRPANPGVGKLYSNGESARLELYTAAGSWENIVQEVPGVSSISGVYSEATDSGVIVIYGTNFVSGAVATAIGSNGVQINATSTVYNSLVQLTATFTGLSNQYEPYDIKVTNPSNLFGLIPDALYINASPVWVTSSGSLGTFYEQVSVSVSATATDSDSTITYTLASGSSLPNGLSLNSSTGAITGTLPAITSNTTYTFTINASDGLTTIPRSFSISAVAGSQVSGTGTLVSSDSTYFYRVYTSTGTFNTIGDPVNVEAVIIGGGGGGGASFGGGGGAGALVLASSKTLNSGSYSIVVGDGAPRNTAADSVRGLAGYDSSAFGFTAYGGGGGGAYNNNYTGNAGGCGGGGSTSELSNSFVTLGGSTTQISQSGTNFYASRGGNSFGGGPYLGTGGGGTGAQGQDISSGTSTAGNGGAGTNAVSQWLSAISSVMPSDWQTATASGRIGGGGGGAGYQNPPTTNAGAGGAGGGANGVTGSSTPGINAIANTGSGGGGGGYPAGGGGAGGKGLVIVRYPKASTTNA